MLVIEDREDAASSLCEALRLMGHEVIRAASGVEALQLAPAFRPGVVVCDIGLPGMDGYEVARRLRGEPATASALLVAITGYALAEDREKARAAGFDRHLAKPPDLDALARLLASEPIARCCDAALR